MTEANRYREIKNHNEKVKEIIRPSEYCTAVRYCTTVVDEPR